MLANKRDLGEDNVVDASGHSGNLLKVARITEVALLMIVIQTLHQASRSVARNPDFEARPRAW